jgi:DNA polymerase V
LDIKSKEKIAIIDVNNFYVSCERLFQPKFEKIPTAVLSNNDGCFIARSSEVKSMGIKMGQPVFELEGEKKDKIKMFSSNYALYGDISDRIVNILKRLVKRVEVYSIDESFLDLTDISDEKLLIEIKNIKSVIEKLTGIPVSIGVGPNKTLAKLCNHLSKTLPQFEGCCSYWDINEQILMNIEIDEVWGIGRRYKKKLSTHNILTVGDFKSMDPQVVRSNLYVSGLRTWAELHGLLCHPIKTKFKTPKQICTSRTFGTTVWEPLQIKNAMWTFTDKSYKKLIKENLVTNEIFIFVQTNRFDDNFFIWSKKIKLLEETDSFEVIWSLIDEYLNELPVRLYYKAGVILTNLKSKNSRQLSLMTDSVNSTVSPVVEQKKWETRRDYLSPQYTTKWDDLPLVF